MTSSSSNNRAPRPEGDAANPSGQDFRKKAMQPAGPVHSSLQKLQLLRNIFALGTVAAPVLVGCILAYVQFALPKDEDKLVALASTLGWTVTGAIVTMVCFAGAWLLEPETRKFIDINNEMTVELDRTRIAVGIAQDGSDLILSDTRRVVDYWSQRHALLERFWIDLDKNLVKRLADLPPLTREEKVTALEDMLQVFSEKLGKFYAGLNNEGDWHMAVYCASSDNTECQPLVTREKNESLSDGQPRSWLKGEGHVGIAFQRFERGYQMYHIPDSTAEAVNELVSGTDQSRHQADAMKFRNVLAVPIHDKQTGAVSGLTILACNLPNVLKRTDFAPLSDLAKAASWILSAPEQKVSLRVDNTGSMPSGTVAG